MKSPEAMSREELVEEVAYLRGEMGLSITETRIQAVKAAFGLARGPARIVLALFAAKGRVLGAFALVDAVPSSNNGDRSDKLADIWVSRIRKAMGKDAIVTAYAAGYALSPVGIATIDKALQDAGVTL